jgi:hypothetical protein
LGGDGALAALLQSLVVHYSLGPSWNDDDDGWHSSAAAATIHIPADLMNAATTKTTP